MRFCNLMNIFWRFFSIAIVFCTKISCFVKKEPPIVAQKSRVRYILAERGEVCSAGEWGVRVFLSGAGMMHWGVILHSQEFEMGCPLGWFPDFLVFVFIPQLIDVE